MVEDGYLTAEQEAAAKNAKLKFVNGGLASSSAPYFVDMVKDHLLEEIFRERSRDAKLSDLHDSRSRSPARGYGRGPNRRAVRGQASRAPIRRLEEEGRGRAAGAGRARGARSTHRRNSRARGRPRLRRKPAQSRAGAAAAGIGVQAIRLRGCIQQRGAGISACRDARDDGGRQSHDVRI